jgi:hypothetical protein
VKVAADVIFLASFFVLGGDFWDKLHALFIREARACPPRPLAEPNKPSGETQAEKPANLPGAPSADSADHLTPNERKSE